MDLPPPVQGYKLTPNLDKNESKIQMLEPHTRTAATVSSGATDICIMLHRINEELRKMNRKLDQLNEQG